MPHLLALAVTTLLTLTLAAVFVSSVAGIRLLDSAAIAARFSTVTSTVLVYVLLALQIVALMLIAGN